MTARTQLRVTVCSVCLRACCWQGRFMCEKSRSASTVELTVKDLKRLDRERPRWWKEQTP